MKLEIGCIGWSRIKTFDSLSFNFLSNQPMGASEVAANCACGSQMRARRTLISEQFWAHATFHLVLEGRMTKLLLALAIVALSVCSLAAGEYWIKKPPLISTSSSQAFIIFAFYLDVFSESSLRVLRKRWIMFCLNDKLLFSHYWEQTSDIQN